MNDQESKNKPNVAPPAAYKAPSLPTLAALGAISAAALMGGCNRYEYAMGDVYIPTDCPEPTEEKSEPSPALPPAEKEELTDSYDGIMLDGDILDPDIE